MTHRAPLRNISPDHEEIYVSRCHFRRTQPGYCSNRQSRDLGGCAVTVPDATDEITFTVDGAGVLIRVDNSDPADHGSYQSDRRKAFHGLCSALVRAGGRHGLVSIQGSATGLAGADVRIALTPTERSAVNFSRLL